MGRRDTFLVVLLLLVIAAIAAIGGATGSPDDRGDLRSSTYIRNGDGAAALFWTLQELGIPVARRVDPFLPDSLHGVLVMLAPVRPPSEEEMGVAADFVRDGGTLVFVAGQYDWGGPAMDTLGLRPKWIEGVSPWKDEGRTARARPHVWTAGTDSVRGFRRVWEDTSRALRLHLGVDTLLTVEGHVAAVAWGLGDGRVIAISDVQPLTNGHLRESGAAAVFARAVAASAGRDTVFFDEYHQGFSGGGSLVGGLARHGGKVIPGGVWLQLGLVAALLLLLGGRRFGAPLPPPPTRRRSPLEHVEALAGAYRQAGAKRTARRLLVAGLARRLGRRAPGDEMGAAEMLGRMARHSPVARDAAAEVEKEFKRGAAADLVALARGVDRYLEEVKRP